MSARAWRMVAIAALWVTGAAAQDVDVPWCQDLPASDPGMSDCALVTGDMVLVFDYSDVPDGAVLQLTQAAGPDAEPALMAPIAVKDVVWPPSLRRLTQDAPDLLIPVSVRARNTVFEIWVQGETGLFGPRGTLTGPDPDAFFRRDGLILQVIPDGPATHIESGFTLTDDGFMALYSVQINAGAGTCVWLTGERTINRAAILADCRSRLRG